MDHSQKMVLTPLDSELEQPPTLYPSTNPNMQFSSGDNASPSTKKSKSHPMLERLTKQLQIVLKIANVKGYDSFLRIKGEKGNYIENSNILNLLQNATSPAKILLGQEEFINLLYQAGVEPELISNENIKFRLMKLYETKPKQRSDNRETQIYSTVPPVLKESVTAVPVIKSTKRALEDDFDEEIEPPNKRQDIGNAPTDWILPEQQQLPDDNNEF